ncbi:hypothetical protein ENBRE01_1010 [Enteropsectra breve]|nr:hypothetical protein ENBRE01_1010 [Enteropsectra breve]
MKLSRVLIMSCAELAACLCYNHLLTEPAESDQDPSIVDGCFSRMLDLLRRKNVVEDVVADKKETLRLVHRQECAYDYELFLKEGLVKEFLPVLRFFCDCFLYDIKMQDGTLVHRGVHSGVSCLLDEEGQQTEVVNYHLLFIQNYERLFENSNVPLQCSKDQAIEAETGARSNFSGYAAAFSHNFGLRKKDPNGLTDLFWFFSDMFSVATIFTAFVALMGQVFLIYYAFKILHWYFYEPWEGFCDPSTISLIGFLWTKDDMGE